MSKPTEYINLVQETLDKLNHSEIDALIEAFYTTYQHGGNIYTMGNGGSGASASHAAGDFLKGASYGLEKRFRMICLNDNLPAMMAIANDIGYDATGKETKVNELEAIGEALRDFIADIEAGRA